MSTIPKKIWYLAAAALIVRLIFLICVLYFSGELALLMGDSRGYLVIAQNIIAGHGFSQSDLAPYFPDSRFPPLYPFLIASSSYIFGSFSPLIIFQIILASFLPALVYVLGKKFTNKESVLWTAAILSAFEPLMIIFSVLLIPHVVSVVPLLLALVFYIKFFEGGNTRMVAYSGALLGVSALIRPHAKFLFILGALYLLWGARRRWKSYVSFLLFLAAFLLILMPWSLRNYYNFGTFDISSTGFRNIYTDVAVSVLSYKTGKEYSQVEAELESGFAERHGIPFEDIGSNPRWGRELAKEGLRIILSNPKDSVMVALITLNSFFTQDLYMYFAQWFGAIPDPQIDFSPSVVLLKDGPMKLISMVWARLGFAAVIPFAGRAFWAGISLLSFIGIWAAFRQGEKKERVAVVFFALIIFYFASTSMAAAFSAHGFHRYPANIFLFLFASHGGAHLRSLWYNRRRIPY